MRQRERGNIFFTLFGAVAVVGVLGAATVSMMRGPLSTMVEVNRRTMADTQMQIASKLALLTATMGDFDGDCEVDDNGTPADLTDDFGGDGFVEPVEWEDDGGGPGSLSALGDGGGWLPASIGASQNDPWGTRYGYCVWDAGTVVDDAKCGGAGQGRLAGNGGSERNYPVIAIISAGPDRKFQTPCLDFASADGAAGSSQAGIYEPEFEDMVPKPPGSDDIVLEFTYAEAAATSGGLWELKATDPATATINKGIEVAQGGSFGGAVTVAPGVTDYNEFPYLKADYIAAVTASDNPEFVNGFNLGNAETEANECFNIGRMAVNSTANPTKLLMCIDIAGATPDLAWVSIGGIGAGGKWLDGATAGKIHYSVGNVGIGLNDPAQPLDVSGNIQLSGNVMLTDGNRVSWSSSFLEDDSFTIGGLTSHLGMTATGDVGLGVIPEANTRLIVKGAAGTTNLLKIADSADTVMMIVLNNGDVGIKDATPDDPLEVGGNIDLSGNLEIDNQRVLAADDANGPGTLYVGLGAPEITATTGANNTVIGTGAGLAIGTGIGNTIFGQGAGAVHTGSNTTILGQGAGILATGDENTLLGQGAGVALTTGIDNILIGQGVGPKLATGNRNILIGVDDSVGSTVVDVPAAGTNDYLNIGNAIYGNLSTGAIDIPGRLDLSDGNLYLSGTEFGIPANCTGANEALQWNGNWVCATASTGSDTDDDLSNNNIGDLQNVSGNGADGQIFINTSGTWTPYTVSGDITLSNAGVAELGTGVVTTTEILDATIATADIANSNVTLAKIEDLTAGVLLGRNDGTAGAPEEITLGSGLTLSGTTLSASIGAGNISDDALDFNKFVDAMTLDASTSISTPNGLAYTLSIVNDGTANSFSVLDSAGDLTPFTIDADGNISTGGNVAILGDLTITGDDLTMTTNTAGHILVADGTNFNPVAMSGDIAISGTGATTIQNDAVETAMILNRNVTYAKLPEQTESTLLGRGQGAGNGDTQQISLGSGLTMTGTTISASIGAGNISDDSLDFDKFIDAMTLDATTTIGAPNGQAFELVIENQGTGNSLVVADQLADTSPFVIDADGNVVVGGALGIQEPTPDFLFELSNSGAVASGATLFALSSADDSDGDLLSVTDEGNLSISGDLTVTGDDITLATNTAGHMLVADGTNYNPVAMSGDVAIDGAGATTIQNSAVTYAKMQNVTADKLLGRGNAGPGAPQEITLGSGLTMTGTTLSASVGAGNITDDTLDWDKFVDAMTLDATTTINMDTNAADFNFDANTFFIDSSTNRIGIGTATPQVGLHLHSASNIGMAIATAGTAVTDQATIDIITMGAANEILALPTSRGWTISGRGNAWGTAADQNDLHFSYWDGTSWVPAMNLDPTGNVGIGTSSPGSKLTVQGGDIALMEDDGGNTAVVLESNNNGGWISIRNGGVHQIQLNALTNSYFLNQTRFGHNTASTAVVDIDSTAPATLADAVLIPRGSDADQPGAGGMAAAANGMIRYNTDDSDFEVHAGGSWRKLVMGASSGGVTPGAPANSVQFNNAGAFGGDANFTWDNTNKYLKIGTANSWSDLEQLHIFKTDTDVTDGYFYQNVTSLNIEPASDQPVGAGYAGGRETSALYGQVVVPGTSTFRINNIYGINGFAENNGTGDIKGLVAANSYALNTGNAHIDWMAGGTFGTDSTGATSVIDSMTGLDVHSGLSGGTVGNQHGIHIGLNQTGGTVTNRHGIYLNTPVGTATNDYGIYQEGTQKNYFGGNIGIGTTASASRLNIAGDILLANSGTCTTASNKGALRLNAAATGLEICGDADTWGPFIAGTTINAFTDLTDTPANYTGAAHKVVKVNAAGNGLEFAGTGALLLPVGTSGEAPAGAVGMIRYDSTDAEYEVWDGAAWANLVTGQGGLWSDSGAGYIEYDDVSYGGIRIGAKSGLAAPSFPAASSGGGGSIGTLQEVLTAGNNAAGLNALNLGVLSLGTTATTERVNIAGAANANVNMLVNITGTGTQSRLIYQDDGTTKARMGFNVSDLEFETDTGATGTGNIEFFVGATKVMHIMNNGNMAVGSADPASKLHVQGDLLLANSGTCAATNKGALRLNATADGLEICDGVNTWDPLVAGGTPGGANTQVQFNDSGAFGGDADFTWDKATNALAIGGSIRMAGIAGNAPVTGSVSGGSTTFTGLTDTPANYTGAAKKLLSVNAAGNAVEFASMYNDAGKLGIGNATPQEALDVHTAANSELHLSSSSLTSYSGIALYTRRDAATAQMGESGTKGWTIRAKGDNAYFGGNLNKMSVYWNNNYDAANGNPLMTWQPDGNIGINTELPTAKLHIQGGMLKIDDDTTTTDQGCIRYNSATDKMQFAHDCTTFADFGAASTVTPAGADGQIQFNSGGTALGADADLSYNNTSNVLTVNGTVNLNNAIFAGTAGAAAPNYMDLATVLGHGNNGNGLAIVNVSGLAVGAASANASALVDLTSTTKGFLFPRMTTAQRNAIASPAEGLQVYNTETDTVDYWNGTGWTSFSSGAGSANLLTDGTNTTVNVDTAGDGSADTTVFTNNGTQTMQIAATGLVGIGDFSSDTVESALHIASGDIRLDGGAANEAGCLRYDDATNRMQFSHDCTTFENLGSTEIWYDSGSGHIRYNDALGGLRVASIAGLGAPTYPTGGSSLWTDLGSSKIHYGTAGTEMVGIGTNNPTVALDIAGSIEYTGTITDVSDRRLKTDIRQLDTGDMLERLAKLDTYTFRMKDDPAGKIEYGVMAQELEPLFPELVHTADDEIGTKSVNYVGLIAPMIEASKALKAENETLRAELASLKTERAQTAAAVEDLAKQVELLNRTAISNTGKASMNGWVILLLAGVLGFNIAFLAGSGILRGRLAKGK